MVELLHRYSNNSYNVTSLRRVIKAVHTQRRTTLTRTRRPPHNIKRRLGLEAIKQIEADYQAGVSTIELAERYSVSAWAITAHLHSAGIPMRLQRVTPDQLQKAAELYASGMSLKAVGAEVGFADSTIYHAFEAAGLPIRRRLQSRTNAP